MITAGRIKRTALWGWILLSAGSFWGCAARKPAWTEPGARVPLEYRMTGQAPLKYQNTSEIVQTMKFGDQSVETQMSSRYRVSMQPTGKEGDRIRLHVTVDSARLDIQSPAGSLSPDLAPVVGKGFDMVLSSLGREIDVSGAGSLKYTIPQAGERTLESEFQAYFEDLPAKPVARGESWTGLDTINVDQSGTRMRMTFSNLNTYEAVEKADGMECVRIRTESTGTLKGEGEQGGAKFEIEGNIKASGTWYFAVQEGILARSSSEATTESKIVMSGPQTMTIPMNMVIRTERALVR